MPQFMRGWFTKVDSTFRTHDLIGGCGGESFLVDTLDKGSSLTELKAWLHDDVLCGIEVTFGREANKETKFVGYQSPTGEKFSIDEFEKITELVIISDKEFDPNDTKRSFIRGVSIKTNKDREWKIMSDKVKQKTILWDYPVGSGICCGVFGYSDRNLIYQIGFVMLKPVKEAILKNVTYSNLDESTKTFPQLISSCTYNNASASDQTHKMKATKTLVNSHTWGISNSIASTLGFKVEGGYPRTFKIGVDHKKTKTSTQKHDNTSTETESTDFEWSVKCSPKSRMEANAILYTYEIETDYEGTMEYRMESGKVFSHGVKGVFKGINRTHCELDCKETSLEPQAFKHDILELPEALVDKVHLVTDLIAQCRSTNTIKGYYRAFMRWKSWASSNGISTEEILPAKAFHASLYLSCLVQQCSSPSPVVTAFYGIKWAHNMISVQSPTDSILVRNVLEGAKRRLSVPVCKKEPITPYLLDKMFNSLFVEGNLYNQRIISACLLSYSGFLRASELLHLKLGDVEFFTTHMRIFIEQSKTDVYRDGNWLVISRCDSKLCPVLNLDRYISYAKISDFDTFLFQNVTKCEHGYKYRQGNKPMSYSRMRELFIEAFKPFVSDIRSYGLHSLRSGGASAAANHGIPDRLFKRHGRWRSENAKDGYIKDSLDDRLSVSKHLGL